MAPSYSLIDVYTSEDARYRGRPVWEALVGHVSRAGLGARCLVFRAAAGSYESGELVSGHIEVLSYNMPVKIEIIVPSASCEQLLSDLSPMVTEGIVAVRELDVRFSRSTRRLLPRSLRAADVMTAEVRAVSEVTPVRDVVRLLLASEFNAAPVVDGDARPVGIITQSDLIARAGVPVRLGLLARLEQEPLDRQLAELEGLQASQVMTAPVTTVTEQTRLDRAVDLMLKRDLKRLPVVDEQGKLVGILARLDVLRVMAGAAAARPPDQSPATPKTASVVREITRRERAAVAPEAPLGEVLDLLAAQGLQRLAVVDAAGHLLGLVTDLDVLRELYGRRGGLVEYIRSLRATARGMSTRTAADVMKAEVITVTEDTPIEQAIHLMAQHGLKRLPVVDPEGRFLGMISRQAVLSAGAGWTE